MRLALALALLLACPAFGQAANWPGGQGAGAAAGALTLLEASANTTEALEVTGALAEPIPGLSFPIAANQQWQIECFVRVSTALTSTGIRLALQCPTEVSMVALFSSWTGAAAWTENAPQTTCPAIHGTIQSRGPTLHVNHLWAQGQNGATPGNVQVAIATDANGQEVTAFAAGSYCFYRVVP